MRQGFVVGALLVTAIACGSFTADAPSAPPAGVDDGGTDAIVDGPVNRDAPAFDASCINGGLRFDGNDWLSVPDAPVAPSPHRDHARDEGQSGDMGADCMRLAAAAAVSVSVERRHA